MKHSINRALLMAVIFMVSCKSAKLDRNIFKIGPITIFADKKWKLKEENGIDSEVKLLVLNNKDTITLEYGKHTYSLNEDLPSIMSLKDKREFEALAGKGLEVSNLIISEKAEEEIKYGLFLNNYYMYDTINGIQVKVVQPKKVGKGITGIYIAELENGNSFVAYGVNLDSVAQKEAMIVFKSFIYK